MTCFGYEPLWRTLTIVSSLMGGCGKGHELQEKKVSSTSLQPKWKYGSYKDAIALKKKPLENEMQCIMSEFLCSGDSNDLCPFTNIAVISD